MGVNTAAKMAQMLGGAYSQGYLPAAYLERDRKRENADRMRRMFEVDRGFGLADENLGFRRNKFEYEQGQDEIANTIAQRGQDISQGYLDVAEGTADLNLRKYEDSSSAVEKPTSWKELFLRHQQKGTLQQFLDQSPTAKQVFDKLYGVAPESAPWYEKPSSSDLKTAGSYVGEMLEGKTQDVLESYAQLEPGVGRTKGKSVDDVAELPYGVQGAMLKNEPDSLEVDPWNKSPYMIANLAATLRDSLTGLESESTRKNMVAEYFGEAAGFGTPSRAVGDDFRQNIEGPPSMQQGHGAVVTGSPAGMVAPTPNSQLFGDMMEGTAPQEETDQSMVMGIIEMAENLPEGQVIALEALKVEYPYLDWNAIVEVVDANLGRGWR